MEDLWEESPPPPKAHSVMVKIKWFCASAHYILTRLETFHAASDTHVWGCSSVPAPPPWVSDSVSWLEKKHPQSAHRQKVSKTTQHEQHVEKCSSWAMLEHSRVPLLWHTHIHWFVDQRKLLSLACLAPKIYPKFTWLLWHQLPARLWHRQPDSGWQPGFKVNCNVPLALD